MPVDPSIVAGLRGPQIPSPTELLQTVATVQDIRERTETRRLAADEARRKHQNEQQREAAYRQYVTVDDKGELQIDYGGLLGHLPAADLPGAMEKVEATKLSAVNYRKAQLELENLGRDYLGKAANAVVVSKGDGPTWEAMIRGGRDLRLLTQEQQQQFSAVQDPGERVAIANRYLAEPKPADVTQITTVTPEGQEVTKCVTPTEGATYPVPPPKPKGVSLQQKDVLINGKPTIVTFDPDTGKSYRDTPAGRVDVSAQVTPMPPMVAPT